MMIVRGVNIFPTQIEELILRTPALSPHFQCLLDRQGRMDTLTVKVERRIGVAEDDARRAGAVLVQQVKNTIGISVAVQVIEPDGVERSMGKMRRIVDQRRGR
jgi:phenylacetate-CoA ligase